jgi:threonine synthase
LNYISTRGAAPELGFEDVLLAGLARDGGLYAPKFWPAFTREQIASFASLSFADLAVEVIYPFVGDEIDKSDLRRMSHESYAGFGHADVTPLVRMTPSLSVLELFHGPTLAFKDVAMQLLARLMDHVLGARGRRATIVGATSGDTGGAAIEAFRASSRVDVVILYPDGRVSDVQRRMMTTPTEANVHAVAVDGAFDDCQALVKAMFNDHAFRDRVQLSGVNSINWARIVAQITYYFAAYAKLANTGEPVSFSVPTGNFGDIFAGYAAKRMGLPIARMIVASNANDILPRTVETGVYAMKSVVATTSPSMDIQISSNFERYLFEASGRNPRQIAAMMQDLSQSGRFELGPLWETLKSDFAANAASEADVADCMRRYLREFGYLLDPHTACGVTAAERVRPEGQTVVLATAHPAKFPDAVERATGVRPQLPARLSSLMADPERSSNLPNDLAAVENFVVRAIDKKEKDCASPRIIWRILKPSRSASGSQPAPVMKRRRNTAFPTSSSTWPSKAPPRAQPSV